MRQYQIVKVLYKIINQMSTDSAGHPKRSVLDPSRVTAYIVCQETSIQMHADDILIYAHV